MTKPNGHGESVDPVPPLIPWDQLWDVVVVGAGEWTAGALRARSSSRRACMSSHLSLLLREGG